MEGFNKSIGWICRILICLLLLSPTVLAIEPIEKVMIVNVDALRNDVYMQTNDVLGLQNLFYLGGFFINSTTVLPSITLAAQASIFTGNNPGSHLVAGHNWFDRNNLEFRSYGPGVWYDDIIWSEGQANDDLSENIQTIYEGAYNSNLNSIVVANHYSRLGDGTTTWKKPGLLALKNSILFTDFHKTDDLSVDDAKVSIEDSDFDILTIYLPGNDENSHENGPSTQLNYINSYTYDDLNEILNALKNQGLSDSTLVVLTSDHGQTEVIDDDAHAIGRDELEGLLRGVGYSVEDDFDESDVVVATNGGMCQVYIRDLSKDWGQYPSIDDLQPALDVFSNQAYVDEILVRVGGGKYQHYVDGEIHNLSYFEDNPDYPDGASRIQGLNCERSGDIILLANYALDYYFENEPKKGVHGNLWWEDSLVPLVFSHPGMDSCTGSGAKNIDIAPTIAELMGFEMPGADGKSLANEVLSCFVREAGESVTITVNVENDGEGDATDFMVEIWEDVPGSGTLIHEETINGLGSGDSVNVSATWSSVTPGHYEFYAVINPLGNDETTTDDNVASRDQTWVGRVEETNAGLGTTVSVEYAGQDVQLHIASATDPVIGGTPNRIDKIVDVTTQQDFRDAEIRISYDEAQLTVREESLRLHWWDEDAGEWVEVPFSGVNTDENYVWGHVDHFSIYTAIGQAKPDIDVQLDIEPEILRDNREFNLSITVGNNGDAPAPNTNFEAYLFDGDNISDLGSWTESLDVGGGVHDNLAPNNHGGRRLHRFHNSRLRPKGA